MVHLDEIVSRTTKAMQDGWTMFEGLTTPEAHPGV
jgi:hypothetical protein